MTQIRPPSTQSQQEQQPLDLVKAFSQRVFLYPSQLSVIATGSVTLLYTILVSTILFFINIPLALYAFIRQIIAVGTNTDHITPPKHVLITGASTGIGQALAVQYVKAGAKVVYITARNQKGLEQTVAQCQAAATAAAAATANGRSEPPQIIPVQLDVTDEESMRTTIQDLDTKTPLDIIIANAGISPEQQREKAQEDILRDTYKTNITGVLNTIFPVYQRFIDRRRGHFVLISSIASFGNIAHPAYSSSKALITTLGQGLRRDLAEFNVNVTVVCPGFIRTNMTRERHESRPNGLPFYQEVDTSAELIYNGVAHNIDVLVFPFALQVLAWALRFIPFYMLDYIALKVAKKVYRAPGH